LAKIGSFEPLTTTQTHNKGQPRDAAGTWQSAIFKF
jgi:hypothetical protein